MEETYEWLGGETNSLKMFVKIKRSIANRVYNDMYKHSYITHTLFYLVSLFAA